MAGNDWSMRRVSTRTTAPRAPLQMSSHMKPKRSWPGVPNRYMTRLSSTVMRPKSMATVVVVLDWTWLVSSMPMDRSVMAASVRRGGISLMAPTKVVFPTPKPPATTNFTDVMRVLVPSICACLLEVLDPLEHAGEGVELDLDRIGLVHFEEAVADQVAGEDDHHPED